MITLNLTNEPQWYDLVSGVRMLLRPLTTTAMVMARKDPSVDNLPEDTSDEQRAVVFAKAIARQAVVDWEGIVDEDGKPVPVTPEAIDAVIDLWPVFEAFQSQYVSKGFLLEQEKKDSSP